MRNAWPRARSRRRCRLRPGEALRRIDAWLSISRTSPSKTACTSTAGRPRRMRRSCRPGAPPLKVLRSSPRSTAAASRQSAGAPCADAAMCCRPAATVHRRSAHAADADRDGPRPARCRRGDLGAFAGARRDAARAGHRPLGQRDLTTGGEETRKACADGLSTRLGPPTRHWHRGVADGGNQAAARRRDLAHIRPVPRSLSGQIAPSMLQFARCPCARI